MNNDTQLTPYSKYLVLKVIFEQFKQSFIIKFLFLVSIILGVINIISDILSTSSFVISIIDSLLYVSFSLLVFFISIAVVTAIHEGGHLSVVKSLNASAFLSVNRLGDVWVHYPQGDENKKLTDYDYYLIGTGPYRRIIDFISLPIFSILWVILILNAPTYVNIVLWILFALYLIVNIANVCAFITVRYRLHDGLIPKIAWFFTSRGDLDGITNYHRLNNL